MQSYYPREHEANVQAVNIDPKTNQVVRKESMGNKLSDSMPSKAKSLIFE